MTPGTAGRRDRILSEPEQATIDIPANTEEDKEDVTEALLIRGWDDDMVALHLSRAWGCKRKDVKERLQAVRERMVERAYARAEFDVPALHEEHRVRGLKLFDEALQRGKLAVAARMWTGLAQLDGFLTTSQVKIAAQIDHKVAVATLDDPEWKRQVDAVLAAEGYGLPPEAQEAIDLTAPESPEEPRQVGGRVLEAEPLSAAQTDQQEAAVASVLDAEGEG